MKNIPTARIRARVFLLCYVKKTMERGFASPMPVSGVGICYWVSRRLGKEMFLISLFDDQWRMVESDTISSLTMAFTVADSLMGIKIDEWIGCHPPPGEKLYGIPRRVVDKMHRKVVEEMNRIRQKDEYGYWKKAVRREWG